MNDLTQHPSVVAAMAGHRSLECATEPKKVVMLHGLAMRPDSWIGLRRHLANRFHTSAPDLDVHATGRPDMNGIAGELTERIAGDGTPRHLVGHDFGAVLAMKIAARHPDRVASLTLIEPLAVNAIAAERHVAGQILQDVRATVANMHSCLAEGDAWTAMHRLTDMINGSGTWERTSMLHRRILANQAGTASGQLAALAADQMCPEDLSGIVCPTRLICGGATSRPLRQIADGLRHSIPFAQAATIAGAGHFPHLSDPHLVDPMVADFLVRVEGQWQDTEVTHRMAA